MTLLIETEDGRRRLGAETDEGAPVLLIPGEDVSLHRLALLETTPEARLQEARMRAVDLAAQPVEDLHVAVGPPDADGASWVGLIDRAVMDRHVARFAVDGGMPAALVPAALLLDPPAEEPTLARLDDRLLIRTADYAALVEKSLLPQLAPGSWTRLPERIAEFAPREPEGPLPLDLLQGPYAPRLRWWRTRGFLIPAAILVLLLVLLLAAPALIERVRSAAAIAGYDEGTMTLARQVLKAEPADAGAAAGAFAGARRLAEGDAPVARLAHAAAAIEGVAGARFDRVTLKPAEGLEILLAGPEEAMREVGLRLSSGPFDVQTDGARLMIGGRRAGLAEKPTPLTDAMLRFVNARADAALVADRARLGPRPDAAKLSGMVSAAGLADATTAITPMGMDIMIPAARSPVLLPLLARMEASGAVITALSITRNGDETLNARIGLLK